jgi:hypothetical protein
MSVTATLGSRQAVWLVVVVSVCTAVLWERQPRRRLAAVATSAADRRPRVHSSEKAMQ